MTSLFRALPLAALLSLPRTAAGSDTAEAPRGVDTWVVLETTEGALAINLLEEVAPEHAENFKKLVRQGHYDGSPFHRAIEDFMAQAGGHWADDGTTTDVGYTLPAEIDPRLRHVRGTVAAARRGDAANPQRRSSGSQFYVCLAEAPWLDGQYTIFGHVVLGAEVLDRIRLGSPQREGALRRGEASAILRAWLGPVHEVRRALSEPD